ncbi:MAG: glucokinase [Dehalococcoidia bacterium]|nr:glucokinase [Dehalococcoidia bacterium]
MLLAGDIVGAKTDLAVFSPESGPRSPLSQAEYPSASYPNLEGIVREFLTVLSWPAADRLAST